MAKSKNRSTAFDFNSGTKPKWSSLPWEKVDVNINNSYNEGKDIFAGKQRKNKNKKNHYDDPTTDATDLYKNERGHSNGADDPGILLGLEVIDGSQYHIEKVGDERTGFINRLVTHGKGQNDEKGTAESSKKEIIKHDGSNNQEVEKKRTLSDTEEENKKKTSKKRKRPKKKKRGKKKNKPSKGIQGKADNKTQHGGEEEKNKGSTTTVTEEQIAQIRNSWSLATGGTFLHPIICSALYELQFTNPTPVQASTLSASILGQKDIVGAAPTGSGKTLSYLLPIVQLLLEKVDDLQEEEEKKNNAKKREEGETGDIQSARRTNANRPSLIALILCPTRELALQVSKEFARLVPSSSSLVSNKYRNVKCGTILGGLSEQKQRRILNIKRPPVIIGTPGRLWELMSKKDHDHISNLSNLRFLVIDEADRMIDPKGSFPQLMNIFEEIQKVDRRKESLNQIASDEDEEEEFSEESIKDLMSGGGEVKCKMLQDVPTIVDHSQEGGEESKNDNPIRRNNETEEDESSRKDEEMFASRQTFVYSATLTLSPNGSNAYKKGRKKAVTVDVAINEILRKAGCRGKPKIVDFATSTFDPTAITASGSLTKKESRKSNDRTSPYPAVKLPPGLRLHEIKCTQKHKDSHLYAYLSTTKEGLSGPCLVFCNSILAVKRVGETLKVLGLPARTLHAQMQQKARFTSLESLHNSKKSSSGTLHPVLVATDVAARGLDIASVTTVVHYDVARATDTFIHRAGRTARGVGTESVGYSVSLVAPHEQRDYNNICKIVLGAQSQLTSISIDGRLLSAAQERVSLASKIVACEDAESKTKRSNQWFIDAANDADLDLDEDLLEEGALGGSRRERQRYIEGKRAKQTLKNLLAKPMRKQSFGKFLSDSVLSEAVRTDIEA